MNPPSTLQLVITDRARHDRRIYPSPIGTPWQVSGAITVLIEKVYATIRAANRVTRALSVLVVNTVSVVVER
jgi:hypothetical protein